MKYVPAFDREGSRKSTGGLSMACFGFFGPARLGGICGQIMPIGKTPTGAFAVLERAAEEDAVVYWGDETGVSNCETVEHGFAPKGHPPVLPVETKRERVNMISAISSRATSASWCTGRTWISGG